MVFASASVSVGYMASEDSSTISEQWSVQSGSTRCPSNGSLSIGVLWRRLFYRWVLIRLVYVVKQYYLFCRLTPVIKDKVLPKLYWLINVCITSNFTRDQDVTIRGCFLSVKYELWEESELWKEENLRKWFSVMFNQNINLHWLFFCFFQFVLLFNWISWENPTAGDYEFPAWAHGFGWMMIMTSLIWIPLVAVYEIIKADGTLMEVSRPFVK